MIQSHRTHYNARILPPLSVPKFSREEECQLVARMRLGDTEARNLLVTSILPWLLRLAQTIQPLEPDECFQRIVVHFIRVLENNYDPKKGRLTTYAKYAAGSAIRKLIKEDTNWYKRINAAREFQSRSTFIQTAKQKYGDRIHIDLRISCRDDQQRSDWKTEDEEFRLKVRNTVSKSLRRKISTRDCDIFWAYVDGVQQKVLAKEYGISTSRINQIYWEVVVILRRSRNLTSLIKDCLPGIIPRRIRGKCNGTTSHTKKPDR